MTYKCQWKGCETEYQDEPPPGWTILTLESGATITRRIDICARHIAAFEMTMLKPRWAQSARAYPIPEREME
jgi:hypothetical protein